MVDHYVGIVVADATKNVIREDMRFDAIISDRKFELPTRSPSIAIHALPLLWASPNVSLWCTAAPYGVREPIARTGKVGSGELSSDLSLVLNSGF